MFVGVGGGAGGVFVGGRRVGVSVFVGGGGAGISAGGLVGVGNNGPCGVGSNSEVGVANSPTTTKEALKTGTGTPSCIWNTVMLASMPRPTGGPRQYNLVVGCCGMKQL